VDVVDGEHIVVGNDNNLPYIAGRTPTMQDDNELILLRVPAGSPSDKAARASYEPTSPNDRV
jgi:hypothetical protein